MKNSTLFAAAAALALAIPAFADVSVRNVSAAQRYPWNGLVDIDYEVVADDPDADVWVSPNGVDVDRGRTLPMLTLSGEGANASVKPGTHRMTWDAAKDAPGYNTQNFQVSMTAVVGASLYLVVDLSGGPDAESYPVRPSAVGPDLADDACRTSNMWLRLVPPGTFTMGSPTSEVGHDWYWSGYETQHEVTITKPFYLAVFECTQKQYQLVMGSTPSSYKGDTRPVECVSYDDIRGTLNGAKWPAHNQVDETSFFGRLRAKTALSFDLPTEAQWEYACRAGTTTALNSGKNISNTQQDAAMDEVGRYGYNQNDGKGGYSSGHTKVGSYLPNAWGFYDMHGNVGEWCLDWWQDNLGTAARTDPEGPSSGSFRLVRGGCWYDDSHYAGYAAACRSAYRSNNNHNITNLSSSNNNKWGFRVACLPAD